MPPETPDFQNPLASPTGETMDGAASITAATEDVSGGAVDLVDSSGANPQPVTEGYVDALLIAAFQLVRKDRPSVVRWHGIKMLQHLLRFRWDELHITEWSKFTNIVKLMSEPIGAPCDSALKHVAAALMAQDFLSAQHIIEDDLLDLEDTLSKTTLKGTLSADRSKSVIRKISGGRDQDDNDDAANVTDDSKEFTEEFVDPRKSGIGGMMFCHPGKGCLLLREYTILYEAFLLVTSCPGTQQDKEVLTCLLYPVNKIWTQQEWQNEYMHGPCRFLRLFSDVQFLKKVYDVVKFFEEQLKRRQTEDCTAIPLICYSTLTALLPLILPSLFQLLRYIHALWARDFAFDLSEKLKRAKRMMGHVNSVDMLEDSDELPDTEEDFEENEMRELLEGIRQSGYIVIGLCVSLEGAFSELLDSSSITAILMEDLVAMEYRHLGKFIHFVCIPLVKHCPHKFWKEWMVNLLHPLLTHCEEVLYFAWFDLLHEGRAGFPYYFGNLCGSEEKIKELEQTILIEITRDVSQLLEALALIELNSGLLWDVQVSLESISSTSIVGYLFLHNCLGSLRMSLFGYWVDGVATKNAIPFCRALVWLAVATKNVRLRLFIVEDLFPCLIRRLDDQLPSAIQRLTNTSDNNVEDLLALCQESYYCIQSQDLAGGDKNNGYDADDFVNWLAKQKEDLRIKSCSTAPKEFPCGFEWNWEFEDEFRRYLPTYLDMLQEVDSMNDLGQEYLEPSTVLQKLKPEFRSKHAINSCEHPHMSTILFMLGRKLRCTGCAKKEKKKYEFVSKLILLKPYIKGSDDYDFVIERLEENCEVPYGRNVKAALHVFYSLLFYWEPQFHPLIREGHKDLLLRIVGQLMKVKERKLSKSLLLDLHDFHPHLVPYARAYIVAELKESMYNRADEQIRLHEDFDSHLASGELDSYMDQFMSSKDDFVKKVIRDKIVSSQFSYLDHDLIILSFERRAEIVNIQDQLSTYSKCLRDLLQNESLKSRLQGLMTKLETEGFFNIAYEHVNWEKKCFLELVDEFNVEVFSGHSLPKYYVIRGIIDYRTILLRKDLTWQDALDEVVDEVCDRWTANIPRFWMDTRYYDHFYYDIIREPLKKVVFKKYYSEQTH